MLTGMEHAGGGGTAPRKSYQLSRDTCISWACCSTLGLRLGFRLRLGLRLRLRLSTAHSKWAISSPAQCSTASSTTSSGSRCNYAPTLNER